MPPSPPNPLKAHLGYWLRLVSNHVSHAFSRRLEEHGVTVAEWVVLRELYEADAIAPSVLAERLGLSRGAVSKLADRLAAKSLLARTADPADRRSHSLTLTDEGRNLVPVLAALADRNDAEAFGVLPPPQREALLKLIKTLARRHGLKTPPLE